VTVKRTAKTPGLGLRLRTRRLELGWTHRELSRVTGINDSYLGQLERGYREPTAHIVGRLAWALGRSTDHFILGTEY